MYTDFDFYANVYDGKLDAETFDSLLTRACKEIDKVTFGRLKADSVYPFEQLDPDDWEAVNWATCCVVDSLQEAKNSGNQRLSSVTNGDYHETYVDEGKSVKNDVLTAAIENLPYYMIELDVEWRLP